MMRTVSRPMVSVVLLLLCMLLAPAAHAQVRAWVDRERIEAGETTTLNISAESLDAAPDYGPLLRDFELSGRSSSRSARSVNGRVSMHTQYSVVLQPRREGVLTIPSLRVGSKASPPLTVTVVPATRVASRAGDIAFIESELDDNDPYVQQAVGLKLRLYYAVPLVSGDLEQVTPDGATLRKVGQDLQYSQEAGGRRYNVVERRYLLIAERSGRLVIPGARFRGQGVGGFFDDLFGDGRTPLAADAPGRVVQVRPIPPNATQPWLPLNDLRLRYVTVPHSVRAGESATVQVEAVADGAVAAQMPELQLTAPAGAQVFPAALQADESFAEGRPRTTLARTFSIVPTRAGTLRIDPPRIDWWDVRAGVARTATLPPIELAVAPGVGTNAGDAPSQDASATSPADAADQEGRIRIPGIQGRVLPWAAAAAGFALLWLLTLLWALDRRAHHAPATGARGAGTPLPAAHDTTRAELKRALADGDLADIGDALCASVQPHAPDLEALRTRIDDPAQREAIDLLQRARWGDADPRVARESLRRAFADGVHRARPARAGRADPLPPLYPRA